MELFSGFFSGGGGAPGAAASPPARAGERYASALRRRLGRHLRHSSAAAWLGQRRRIVDAAVRAAATDQRVFTRVVDLGLGDGLLDLRTLGRIAGQLPRGNQR